MLAALALGGGLALALGRHLNALALGADSAGAFGLDPRRVWMLACLAVMVLAGAATAAAGPIGFVGLVAPHLARALTGPDNRRLLPLSALSGASMLLAADILGRVVAPPAEVAAGIVAAILGGPFFIHVVRRFRLARLHLPFCASARCPCSGGGAGCWPALRWRACACSRRWPC